MNLHDAPSMSYGHPTALLSLGALLEPLGATWVAMCAQSICFYFQSIPFLKMPHINFSKGLALQSYILGLPSHINRFEHPPTLKEHFTAEDEEEKEEETEREEE